MHSYQSNYGVHCLSLHSFLHLLLFGFLSFNQYLKN